MLGADAAVGGTDNIFIQIYTIQNMIQNVTKDNELRIMHHLRKLKINCLGKIKLPRY